MRHSLITVLLLSAGLAACGGVADPPPDPVITIERGSFQEAVTVTAAQRSAGIMTVMPDSLVLRVTDRGGAPLAGVPVRWVADAGTLYNTSTVTDANGRAAAAWNWDSQSGWASVGTHAARAFVGDHFVSFTGYARAGPLARSIEFSPATVNVHDGPATVTVSVRLTDDRTTASLSYATAQFYNPSAVNALTFQSAAAGLALVSGTPEDGIWRGTVTIPQDAEAGAWFLGRLTIGWGCGVTKRFELWDGDLRALGVTWQLMVDTQPLANMLPAAAPTTVGPGLAITRG